MKLMKRCAAGLAAVLLTANVTAQTPAATYDVYVEANRPKMAVRALSVAEQAQAKAAVKAWTGKKTEANLLAVKPWAEAGHPDAMKTMVKGYEHLQKSAKDRGASVGMVQPDKGLTAMTGLWALRTGATLGWNKSLAKTAKLCISTRIAAPGFATMTGIMDDYDCGVAVGNDVTSTIDLTLDGISSPYKGTTVSDLPVLDATGVKTARMEYIFGKFGSEPDKQWWYIDKADRAWVEALIAADPAIKAKYEAARFDMYIRAAAKGTDLRYMPESAWMEQYAALDPQRSRQLENASASYRNKMAVERASFGSQMITAGDHNRFALSQTAFRSGGQLAADWYAKFGATLTQGEPQAWQWCNLGVQQACADARWRQEQLAAEAAAVKARDQAGLSGGGADGGRTAEEITQALKDHNEQVNTANCARADLGASIACKRD
jgi:hypothetical protein